MQWVQHPLVGLRAGWLPPCAGFLPTCTAGAPRGAKGSRGTQLGVPARTSPYGVHFNTRQRRGSATHHTGFRNLLWLREDLCRQLQPQLRTEATSTRTPPDCSPRSVPTCRRSAPEQAGCCWRPPPWPPSSSASVSHRLPPGCAPRALPSAAVALLGEFWPARSRLHFRARHLLNLTKLRKEIVPAFKAGAAAEQPLSPLHVFLPVL